MPQPIVVSLDNLPAVDMRQFLGLADDTGMLQHALFGAPNHHHGYCIDDNCRALIVSLIYSYLRGYHEESVPLQRYLAFIAYAFNESKGRFRNFMSYDRRWLEEVGSEDSHARTVWSLGLAVRLAPNDSILGLADRLFHQGLAGLERFENLRPRAYGLIGLCEYKRAKPNDRRVGELQQAMAEKLFNQWQSHATEDWPWWEDTLTWGNAKIPNALLVAGESLCRDEMIEVGLTSLRWLLEVQTSDDDHLSVIGNDGWYHRGGQPAQFDQQPIEIQCLVQACLAASQATGDSGWVDEAIRCFKWFLGANDLGQPLYNQETGGCHDGLAAHGVNQNQGAESTLAYLLSLLDLHRYIRQA